MKYSDFQIKFYWNISLGIRLTNKSSLILTVRQPNARQVIIGTNEGVVYWRRNVSLGHNVLISGVSRAGAAKVLTFLHILASMSKDFNHPCHQRFEKWWKKCKYIFVSFLLKISTLSVNMDMVIHLLHFITDRKHARGPFFTNIH